MTAKTKGRNGGDRATQNTSDSLNHTGNDRAGGMFKSRQSEPHQSPEKRGQKWGRR